MLYTIVIMAIQVGIGLSMAKDHALAVKEAIGQARINIPKDKIDLAVVFTSIEFAYHHIIKRISSLLGSIPIIGCTGTAIISHQGIFKHGLAIMLLGLPEGVYFNAAYVKEISTKSALAAGEELGEKLLYGCKDVRRDLSLIFSDGLLPDSSGLIWGIQERLGRSFPLVGGCASDNFTFKKTYLYFNQEIFNDAACGILLGGKLNFGLGVKHGWKPLGKPRYITKSKGNILYEIDNAPAVKLYEEYFGKGLSELKKDLTRISIFYPIGIYLEGEEEYLLRNIFSIEENGALVLQGNVVQKSLTRLMIGTKEACLDAAQQAAEEAKRDLGGTKINFALVFDSASRYILLGRKAGLELETVKERLGKDTPFAGVYTYGEQAPLRAVGYRGKTYFHNQTITILTLGD